ncbi:MAG: hypothetical protein JKY65_09985, partial [Planctomycetes bacterium]|nr:hypothetical protein [Planctomycetota bacterium]
MLHRTHAQRGLALALILVLAGVFVLGLNSTNADLARPLLATLGVAGCAALSAALLGGGYAL